MSFTTAEPNAIVLSAMGGGWEEWDSNPETTDSGWDTISISLAKDYKGGGGNGLVVAREFPIGRRIGGSNFWVTGCRPRLIGGAIWGCTLMGKGLASPRALKVSGGTGVDQQSYDGTDKGPIFVPGIGNVNRLQVLEASPSVTVEYISFNAPATGMVGQAGYAPYVTAVRQSVWGSLTDPLAHFPSGWVMIDIRWDKLVGVNVWLIAETWLYIHKWSP